MKKFYRIIQSSFLITTSVLTAQPANETLQFIRQSAQEPIRIPDLRTLSYDEVIDLLSWIESDAFEDKCSIDELDQINQFIAFLANEGATEEEKSEMNGAIASLYRKESTQYAFWTGSESGYNAIPAIYTTSAQDILLCKSWFKKQWDNTKDFVKNHKKEIIIGAIIVVTVAVVAVAVVAISSSAAATSAASGVLATVGSSTGMSSNTPELKEERTHYFESEKPLTSSLKEELSSFKKGVAKEQFAAAPESNGISIEENGRIVGSFFAHKTIDTITSNFTQNPSFANELKNFEFNPNHSFPNWMQSNPEISISEPHSLADLAFSTKYENTYAANGYDVNMLSYETRGRSALFSEYYKQAAQDFGKAISLDPNNSTLYLERGIANFKLGEYEQSINDYNQFLEKKSEPFSVTDFSLGFAKGVPKGICESGKGALLFLSDFISHPVETSKQVFGSLTQLAMLVKNDEFSAVAEILSPELHHLATQWDTLSSERRGELAGYAVGKLGTDCMVPGAMAKLAKKSANSAKELAAICQKIQFAQDTLILETAAGIGVPVKVAEIVEMGKKATALGEELGFTTQEMAQLQKTGNLKKSVSNRYEHFTPEQKKSFDLFKNAQEALNRYKGFMPESQARELIHQTGIKTFARPTGIPENYRVKLSSNGAGIKYVHPTDEGTYIRVMPGKPHSPHPCQQKPYITRVKNGNTIDKYGNIVDKQAPEAHIPYEEFIYQE